MIVSHNLSYTFYAIINKRRTGNSQKEIHWVSLSWIFQKKQYFLCYLG